MKLKVLQHTIKTAVFEILPVKIRQSSSRSSWAHEKSSDFPQEDSSTAGAESGHFDARIRQESYTKAIIHAKLYHAAYTFLHNWFAELTKSLGNVSGQGYFVGEIENIIHNHHSPVTIHQREQNHHSLPLIVAAVGISATESLFYSTQEWLQPTPGPNRTKLVILVDIQENKVITGRSNRDRASSSGGRASTTERFFTVHMSLWRSHLPPQCVFVGTISPDRAWSRLGESRSNAISFMKSELVPGLCHTDDDPIRFQLEEFWRFLRGTLEGRLFNDR